MSSYPLFTHLAEGKQVKKTKVKGIAFQLIKYFFGHFAYYLTHIYYLHLIFLKILFVLYSFLFMILKIIFYHRNRFVQF